MSYQRVNSHQEICSYVDLQSTIRMFSFCQVVRASASTCKTSEWLTESQPMSRSLDENGPSDLVLLAPQSVLRFTAGGLCFDAAT